MMMIIDEIRKVAERHPAMADIGVTTVLALANGLVTADAGPGLADWLLFGTVHLPVVWRRRAPVAAFWMVYGLAVAAWFTARADFVYPVVVILVAVYSTARHRPWRQTWPGVTAVELTLLLAALRGHLPGSELAVLTVSLVAVVLLGVALRTRQAYLLELRDRARRLGRERDQQARLAAAAERARIAREMHDIVAHNVSVMVALADGAGLTALTAPPTPSPRSRPPAGRPSSRCTACSTSSATADRHVRLKWASPRSPGLMTWRHYWRRSAQPACG